MAERDPEVVVYQKRLRETGWYTAEIDGDFGPKTLAAGLKSLEHLPVLEIPVATPNIVVFDHKSFFDSVREDLGVLNQNQVSGFNTFFKIWDESKLTDIRWLAYMMATAWHETAFTMQPVTEYGGLKYLKSKKYYPYYGRGYVQLTWKENYAKYGIENTPERALEPDMAAHIMVDGMVNAKFTKYKLSDYFNDKKEDPTNARRIINGTDKAAVIAGYYRTFSDALKAVPVNTAA